MDVDELWVAGLEVEAGQQAQQAELRFQINLAAGIRDLDFGLDGGVAGDVHGGGDNAALGVEGV